jgi:Ca-activated chloride channel family protein
MHSFLAILLFAFSCNSTHKNVGNEVSTTGKSYYPKKNMERSISKEQNDKIKGEESMGAGDDYAEIEHNTEEYSKIVENGFISPQLNPLSTFSIDVDAASYTNCRRMIENGQIPHSDVVRIEEFVNYFDYNYENPKGEHPFSVYTEVSTAPWNNQHYLVHIGLQGKKLDYEQLAPSNLVFLIDVSGSMEDEKKLPLLKSSFKLLINQLSSKDRVSLVVYAGAAGVVLPPTPATEKDKIFEALDNLKAGGSTAGGEGIVLAYKMAKEAFIAEGNNRIILATDGDFNVGVSSTSELVSMIEEKRKEGIYLTICGFGLGNYKDYRLEELSKNGNGNYFYIDNIKEAQKVFVKEMRATLFTIAKDVKLQLEFNPTKVQAYRLIGYENRVLKNEDFNDDKKDAGELGAGHTVTALYEIIPVGVTSSFIKEVDKLKYQTQNNTSTANLDELLTLKLRYKKPQEEVSNLLQHVVNQKIVPLEKSSEDFRFSAAVTEFALILRNSEFKGESNFEHVLSLAKGSKGDDEEGYRSEFIKMVEVCSNLKK